MKYVNARMCLRPKSHFFIPFRLELCYNTSFYSDEIAHLPKVDVLTISNQIIFTSTDSNIFFGLGYIALNYCIKYCAMCGLSHVRRFT